MTRWNIVISDNTDKSLRAFLGQQGAKKGSLSQFVEEAVRSRLFELTVNNIKTRNSQADQQEIMQTIDDAVDWARAHRT